MQHGQTDHCCTTSAGLGGLGSDMDPAPSPPVASKATTTSTAASPPATKGAVSSGRLVDPASKKKAVKQNMWFTIEVMCTKSMTSLVSWQLKRDAHKGQTTENGCNAKLASTTLRVSGVNSRTAEKWFLLVQGLSFNADTVTWNLVAGLELLAVSRSSPVSGVGHLLGLAWPCVPEL